MWSLRFILCKLGNLVSILVVAPLFLALVSCASNQRPLPGYAFIKAKNPSQLMPTSELFVTFIDAFDDAGNVVAEDRYHLGVRQAYDLLPGIYSFGLRCSNSAAGSGVSSFARIRVVLKADTEYFAYCLVIRNEENDFGLQTIVGMYPFVSQKKNYETDRVGYLNMIESGSINLSGPDDLP